MKFTKFMKFYFWAAVVLYIAGTVSGLTIDSSDDFFKYKLYVDLLWFVGLFGYSYSKNIFAPFFWVLFLPLLIGLDIIDVIETITIFEEGKMDSEDAAPFVIVYTLIFLLSVPAHIAIYLYGFERDT